MKLSALLSTISLATTATPSPLTPQAPKAPIPKWTDLPPVGNGFAIQEHGTTATTTHLYVLGGIPPNASLGTGPIPTTNTFMAYSFSSNSWQNLTPLPLPYNHINAAAVGDRIYVLGGLTGVVVNTTWYATPASFIYDIASDTWTSLPPVPAGQARGASAIGVSGSTIYFAGGMQRLEVGEGGLQASVDTVTSYDTTTGAWTTLPSIPAPRDHVGGAVIGRRFWVVGGRDHGQTNVRNTTWSLDLDAPGKGWTAHAEMPTARGGLAMGVIGGWIATFGGEGNPDPAARGVYNETEVYSIETDTWYRMPPMPHPRHGTAAASVDGRIYIPGGGITLGAGPVDTFDAFELYV